MRPRAVLLTPVRPAAGGNGLAMRAGLFLEGLARSHDVDVAVVPLFGPSSAGAGAGLVERLAASCRVLAAAGPEDARELALRGLATPAARRRAAELLPLPSLCRLPSAAGLAELRGLWARADLVHAQRLYLAPWLDGVLDAAPRPACTLDLDELDPELERLERYYLPRLDAVYVAAEEDAAQLGPRAHAVANAVRAPGRLRGAAPRFDLLFVGNLSYAPNVDAARWLCAEIKPRLAPGATVALVGSSPAPEVRALGALPGVTLAADVPEVAPFYAAARIAVAPLRSGGGTRTKIIEALVHERPVVSTWLGARGLPGAGIVRADTADEFAAACRGLLGDPSSAAHMAAEGRAAVVSVDAVVDEIDRLSRRVGARRPAGID